MAELAPVKEHGQDDRLGLDLVRAHRRTGSPGTTREPGGAAKLGVGDRPAVAALGHWERRGRDDRGGQLTALGTGRGPLRVLAAHHSGPRLEGRGGDRWSYGCPQSALPSLALSLRVVHSPGRRLAGRDRAGAGASAMVGRLVAQPRSGTLSNHRSPADAGRRAACEFDSCAKRDPCARSATSPARIRTTSALPMTASTR
jgi:hypothetical protein